MITHYCSHYLEHERDASIKGTDLGDGNYCIFIGSWRLTISSTPEILNKIGQGILDEVEKLQEKQREKEGYIGEQVEEDFRQLRVK